MNFKEFRKQYAWTLKKYPGTMELYYGNFDVSLIGTVTTENYEKRGNKWFLVSTERNDVSPAYYFNTVDAVPFFRNLGGYEKVTCGYCGL